MKSRFTQQGPVAQWITRLPTEQKIAGSIPAWIVHFLLFPNEKYKKPYFSPFGRFIIMIVTKFLKINFNVFVFLIKCVVASNAACSLAPFCIQRV